MFSCTDGSGLNDLIEEGWTAHGQIRLKDTLVGVQDPFDAVHFCGRAALKHMSYHTAEFASESPNSGSESIGVRRHRVPNGDDGLFEVIQRNRTLVVERAGHSGIAIGTGTDVAIETADVVLMSGDLRGVENATEVSVRTMANIRQNLIWALVESTGV